MTELRSGLLVAMVGTGMLNPSVSQVALGASVTNGELRRRLPWVGAAIALTASVATGLLLRVPRRALAPAPA